MNNKPPYIIEFTEGSDHFKWVITFSEENGWLAELLVNGNRSHFKKDQEFILNLLKENGHEVK